jgi:hypothetical protein
MCPRKSIGIPAPPNPLNCLFVAWNPPTAKAQTSDNFWNNPDDNLRHNLLGILKLKGISEFHQRGFFLIHALKCATKSSGLLKADSSFSRLVLGKCVPKHLRREVEELQAPRLCLLGGIAKQAIALFCPDVGNWTARPRMGKKKEINMPYGKVDCLYTCLPIYRVNVPYTRDHLSNWL